MFTNTYLISVEGCDGVGKTTLIKQLADYYKECEDICFVKYASNKQLDECVYRYRKSKPYNPYIHMCLETLSTYITLIDTIESMKELPEHLIKIIVLDRYWYSLLAYTNVLLSQNIDNSVMKILPRPELVVYLSGDPAKMFLRKHKFEPIETGLENDDLRADFCAFQTKIDREYRRLLNESNQEKIEIKSDACSFEHIVLCVTEKINEIHKLNDL